MKIIATKIGSIGKLQGHISLCEKHPPLVDTPIIEVENMYGEQLTFESDDFFDLVDELKEKRTKYFAEETLKRLQAVENPTNEQRGCMVAIKAFVEEDRIPHSNPTAMRNRYPDDRVYQIGRGESIAYSMYRKNFSKDMEGEFRLLGL